MTDQSSREQFEAKGRKPFSGIPSQVAAYKPGSSGVSQSPKEHHVMTNTELILRAQGYARCLSYNEDKEAPVKHTLHELCHRLDAYENRPFKYAWRLICFGVKRKIRRLGKKSTGC